MFRSFIIAVASAVVLTFSAAVFAQPNYGTADEAKAMLLKAVAALKADKAKTLDQINDGQGGFLDRDLYVFCVNAGDGKLVAVGNPNVKQLLGTDYRTIQDVDGKAFGEQMYDAYHQNPEGQITEVSYMWVRPGPDKTPVPKVSFVTRIGDLGCGVGYYIKLQTQTPSATVFAQQQNYGTGDEAKAMLLKAVAALKADKAKTLDQINDGQGGFLDRDLYVFCVNVGDGKLVAVGNPNVRQLLGTDSRTIKDVNGEPFGQEMYDAYQKPEGQITEVSYMWVRPGPDKTPVPKVSFVTKIGDLGCGVGYYIRLQTQTP
jgi:hypothetical protein